MNKHLFSCALLCSLLMTSLSGFAQKSAKVITCTGQGLALYGISPNGKYAALTAGSQGEYGNPTLWNLETDELTVQLGPDDAEDSQIFAHDVDNNGMLVGSYGNIPAYFQDGKWNELPLPEKFEMGKVTAVSADGSVMVGWASNGSDTLGTTCKWVNKQLVDMKLPATDSRGETVDTPQLFDVSTDGSVVWGYINYTYLTSCTPMVWAPEPQTVCEDLYYNEDGKRNHTAIYASVYMSPNGKYMTGYVDYDMGAYNVDGTFFYDVKTQKTKTYLYTEDNEDIPTRGYAVDNDAVIYEATETGSAVRQAYIRIKEVQYDMTEYVKEEYNCDLNEETGLSNFGTVQAVSDDGKTVIGFEGPYGNWCLKYSEAPGADPTAIESNEANQVAVFVNGRNLIVEGNAESVMISDLTGKTVLNQTISGSSVSLAELPQGIYVATVISDGQHIVKKIAVK